MIMVIYHPVAKAYVQVRVNVPAGLTNYWTSLCEQDKRY